MTQTRWMVLLHQTQKTGAGQFIWKMGLVERRGKQPCGNILGRGSENVLLLTLRFAGTFLQKKIPLLPGFYPEFKVWFCYSTSHASFKLFTLIYQEIYQEKNQIAINAMLLYCIIPQKGSLDSSYVIPPPSGGLW